jgi:two-component system nitrogen regulation sensor histidine kinase GlnL
MLDDSLAVTFMNPAAETLLGVSERQVLGHGIADLIDPCEELIALCRRVLATGLTFRLREYACRSALGPVLIDCRARQLEIAPGILLELSDSSFDVRLRQEAELIAQQKLSRRIARQLAHEVKNPLGGMRGSAQLLQKRLGGDPELTAYTKVIIDEVDRLAALVDSILQAGGKSNPTRINIHEVTEHVAKLVEAEKPEGVTLVRDYDPSLPDLTVDRNQIIQALLNVVRNAMQAVGDSGTLKIRTRAQSHVTIAGQLHRLVLSIEVEDDGPGIAEDLKENIFYPLVTGRTTGTGLGLTIAQDLVSRNNGLIEVSSEPGCTVFKLRLPVTAREGTKEASTK